MFIENMEFNALSSANSHISIASIAIPIAMGILTPADRLLKLESF